MNFTYHGPTKTYVNVNGESRNLTVNDGETHDLAKAPDDSWSESSETPQVDPVPVPEPEVAPTDTESAEVGREAEDESTIE